MATTWNRRFPTNVFGFAPLGGKSSLGRDAAGVSTTPLRPVGLCERGVRDAAKDDGDYNSM